MDYIAGTAGQPFRLRMGPGEYAGPDAPPPPLPPPTQGAPRAGGFGLNVQGLPLLKPPYGTITAISLDRGEIVWQVPHGETPDNVRDHAALKGMTIPKTGQSGTVGTLVTKTLLIAGDGQLTTPQGRPRGAMLRAYDKATGKELGAIYMPSPQTGSPMTYLLNGKQYIVVAISGGTQSAEYVAFAVPSSATPTSAAR